MPNLLFRRLPSRQRIVSSSASDPPNTSQAGSAAIQQTSSLRYADGMAVGLATGHPLRLTASRGAMSSAWEGERVLDGFASIGRVEACCGLVSACPEARRGKELNAHDSASVPA